LSLMLLLRVQSNSKGAKAAASSLSAFTLIYQQPGFAEHTGLRFHKQYFQVFIN
jgi:hypothetical protein